MSPRRIAAGRGRLTKAIVALVVASACFAAVAYAANRAPSRGTGLAGSKPVAVVPPQQGTTAARGEERLPRARFVEYPAASAVGTEAQFRFHVAPRAQSPAPAPVAGGGAEEAAPARRFQCRLDEGEWSACGSPRRLGDLIPGGHRFAVRALSRSGRPGEAVAYGWQQVAAAAQQQVAPQQPADPMPFSIELRSELDDLFPGDPAQPLAVTVVNPNPVPIEITSLTAAISGEPLNCPVHNFELAPSSASPEAPLLVPAGAEVALPTATVTAPSIAMLNLPENQDACRGAALHLDFFGEAG